MPHEEAEADPWTYALESDGDIRWDSREQSVRTIAGDNATRQDLKVALATYKGTDPRDPDFGLNVFGTLESITALKREIRRTLEYDDYRHNRVTSVRSVRVYGARDGDRKDVQVEATVSLAALPDETTLVFDLTDGSLSILARR